MPPPATLMEELIEEILLRLPPKEPASLFRASLVCKPWCRLISGPRFRRRYREFHRTPPMLGFLCGRATGNDVQIARFVPTSALCPPPAERRRRHLVDARHGRVLLHKLRHLVVWDPISDEQREIPMPKLRLPPSTYSFNAAVVCAALAGTCDHLDCHRGPFLVVFVVSVPGDMLIWTYSSDTGSWSDPIFGLQNEYVSFEHLLDPSMLVGNVLYFGAETGILRYDLGSHEMSAVRLPPTPFLGQPFSRDPYVLTTPEDGRLGLATIHESKLYMWSTKHGPEADAVWTCDSVIELETLLCNNAILAKPVLVGFVDRIGVGFLRADDLLFTVDLNTHKVKKVYKGRGIHTVVPYMSFCTPALGGGLRGEGPSASVSIA